MYGPRNGVRLSPQQPLQGFPRTHLACGDSAALAPSFLPAESWTSVEPSWWVAILRRVRSDPGDTQVWNKPDLSPYQGWPGPFHGQGPNLGTPYHHSRPEDRVQTDRMCAN